MTTLLQNLLLETLPADIDPTLHKYIEKILPALEREFSSAPAMGGDEEITYQTLMKTGDKYARENAQRYSTKGDQNLCVHVLNALLTAWNLIPYLNQNLALSETEKRLMCLGTTLHDYDKHCRHQGIKPPHAAEVEKIIETCCELGKKLNFDAFWQEWQDYLPEIAFLAQNTHNKHGTNLNSVNWGEFKHDPRRLKNPLRYLIAFGDVAVHMSDPGDIVTQTAGARLREHLDSLGIKKKLVYHRLRDTLGILTNAIHNATVLSAKGLGWQPLLFFAQGVIYLAPFDYEVPERKELSEFIWQQIRSALGQKMLEGEIGFKRDGKGLKVAPQTLEFFQAGELIRELPVVVKANVANVTNPATPKRLDTLDLEATEKELLTTVADIRSDRLAEFLILVQKEFLANCPEYITWVLDYLELADKITPEQTQIQAGGVNRGWYYTATHYIVNNSSLDDLQVQEKLQTLSEDLATWAENNNLLPEHHSPTEAVFCDYLNQYLEIQGWEYYSNSFITELNNYEIAKTNKAKVPICSLSSGEFTSEDQLDSVVLFKSQQYSNKNALGGGRIKRGISKIWSLEMLLRQAFWSASSGKFVDLQPVFLYIFPAYVYSPQTVGAIKLLCDRLNKINLWDIRKTWINNKMNISALSSWSWLKDVEPGDKNEDRYESSQLPFMATIFTTTREKTLTDAWVQPIFLALALPLLLGVRVISTDSFVPLYNSDSDFKASVIIDEPGGFYNLLKLPTSLRIQQLKPALEKLLIAYSIHLDTRSSPRSSPPNPRWQDLIKTVRGLVSDVLNIFSLAFEGLRRDNRENLSAEEINRYLTYAEKWSQGDSLMTEKLFVTKKITEEYYQFYRVDANDSSHSILLPFTKALEQILAVPDYFDDEELILQGTGEIQRALDRQKIFKRPLMKDKTVEYTTRQIQEQTAIETFMTTCIKELFGKMCKGDRALLQQYQNRFKSGVIVYYQKLARDNQSTVNS
jgi:CRISPR-associated protein Csc3